MSTSNNFIQPCRLILVKTDSGERKDCRRLNTKDLRKSDLEALRENDKFMYFSVPGTLEAAMFGKDLEFAHENLRHDGIAHQDSSSIACRSEAKVLRKSRMSFEVDALSFMKEELLAHENGGCDDDAYDVLFGMRDS